MKIGLDAKRAYNNFSGLGNYSRYVINGLVDQFPVNEYYAFTPKFNDELSPRISPKVIREMPVGALGRAFSALWRTYGIASMVASKKLDVYHGLSNELPVGIGKKQVKSVVTIHDLIFKRYPELYKAIDRRIYDKKFRYACNVSDKIIAISEQTKADIIEFYGIEENKISVVYQDCAPIFKVQQQSEDQRRVKQKYSFPSNFLLSVGTIEPRKNQFNLVKALKQLDENTSLVLVGRKTNYVEQILEYVLENGLEKRVVILEDVDQNDLPSIYSLAKIFVYPSKFEGFGIPIIEAQNVGVPVITSKGSCFAETGGDAAIYIDHNNVDELTQAISKLQADDKKCLQMIALGKENVKRFTAEVTIPQIHRIYQSI